MHNLTVSSKFSLDKYFHRLCHHIEKSGNGVKWQKKHHLIAMYEFTHAKPTANDIIHQQVDFEQ